MATAMQMDEWIVDYLVLGPNNQDRKVPAKSVAMGTLFKLLQRIALKNVIPYLGMAAILVMIFF